MYREATLPAEWHFYISTRAGGLASPLHGLSSTVLIRASVKRALIARVIA